MIEILFSGFWPFVGGLIYLSVICSAICYIVDAIGRWKNKD